ncbi:MAG TPA: efflux RND transporter periplasmic adaptor subunit [Ohtaekwangia sp.]|uniref:efflux RND transporter periplasmic adaptor subunit n=1 Tax=Ohtaekwangia sp. TaxID=2066019 RepID=UPI002F931FE5
MSLKNILSYASVTLLLAAFACGNKNQQGMQGPPPVNVAVQTVSTGDAAYYDEYPAIVRALQEVELRPQVSGYITGIHFTEGQQVKKGQKLYSIDPQQTSANYNQALANLSVQEANLDKAKRDVDRYRELDKKDAIAKQQVDYAEATYAAAEKQVEAAKAAVRSVQTSVRYATIVAPFDGTIGISAVRLGAAVTPGQTVLNTISSDNPIAVDITVDQQEIYRFTELLGRKVSKGDSTFRLSFKGELYPYPGKISVIDRAVDPQTGTIKMRIEFPNVNHSLRSGMSGTLLVQSTTSKSVIIPYKAVNEQLGEFYVYVADSAKATQVKIKLGKQIGRNIIIREGLKEGDVIITEGIQNLREGTPINIAPPAPAGNAPQAAKK